MPMRDLEIASVLRAAGLLRLRLDETIRRSHQVLTIGISSQRVVYLGERRSCLVAHTAISAPLLPTAVLPRRTESRPNRLFRTSMAAISLARGSATGDAGSSPAENKSSSPCSLPAACRSVRMAPAFA